MNPTQIYSTKQFWRITVNTQGGRKSYWACDYRKRGERFCFCVVDRDGAKQSKVVFGTGDDLIKAQNARLNLFFGAMELA